MDIALQIDLCIRVAVATALSALIGFERERSGQSAGLRTHMLVGLGAALFTVVSIFAFAPGDPGRVAAQIVTGIGFLGAGAIIQRRDEKEAYGMTTAAGIWAVAAVGMACGVGAYVLGAFCALLMVLVLALLSRVSNLINPTGNKDDEHGETARRTSGPDDDGAAGAPRDGGLGAELHRKIGGKEQQTR
jgi:putative Mg2+ transporter-C (MgtC) family protein